MASPFKVFRRNQKMAIAVLGVMTMLAFVLLPGIMQNMGSKGGGSVQDPVVVKTAKFGDLHASDLKYLHLQRLHVLGVLGELKAEGAKEEINALVAAGKLTPQMAFNALNYYANPATCRKDFERVFGPAEKESEVDTWLLAKQAKQMGIVVSDDFINNFLKSITKERVERKVFEAAFKHAGISDLQFFEMMCEELLALNYENLIQVSMNGKTPAERWDGLFRPNARRPSRQFPWP